MYTQELATRKGEVVGTIKVDDEDAHLLQQVRWYPNISKKSNTIYVIYCRKENGKIISRYLHREIMKPKKGMVVDHINGDGLDCRKENMRVCTHGDNLRARRSNKKSTSKYRGVSKTQNGKWTVQLQYRNKSSYLGVYETELEAAKAYDDAVLEIGDPFLRPNLETVV